MTDYDMDDEAFIGDDGYDPEHNGAPSDGSYQPCGGGPKDNRRSSRLSTVEAAKDALAKDEIEIVAPEARLEWATTAISSVAYLASLAAVLIALSDSWRDASEAARFSGLAIILAATYGMAILFHCYSRKLPSRVFFVFGAIFFGLALVFVRAVEAPNDATVPEAVELLSDGISSVFAIDEPSEGAATLANSRDFAGFWAIGVFLLALSLSSVVLHFLAILTCLCWWSATSLDYVPPIILIFCVLGEMWAWRSKDRMIAMLYIALGLCMLCSNPSLWEEAMAPALATLFALIVFWIGATFKNAIIRGFGLALGGLGLGWMTFPQYWQTALPQLTSRFGFSEVVSVDSRVSTALAFLFCAIFILFALNMIVSGAARSSVRLWYGIGIAVIWLFVIAGMALRLHGPRVGAFTMFIGAFVFFVAYEVERYLERVFAENFEPNEEELKGFSTATTDGALDDPEFDDPLDREARETAERGLIPFEIMRNRCYTAFLKKATPVVTGIAIALQFLFLYFASFLSGK